MRELTIHTLPTNLCPRERCRKRPHRDSERRDHLSKTQMNLHRKVPGFRTQQTCNVIRALPRPGLYNPKKPSPHHLNFPSSLLAALGGTQMGTKKTGTKMTLFKFRKLVILKPIRFDALWVLLKRHPNGYQTKCLV